MHKNNTTKADQWSKNWSCGHEFPRSDFGHRYATGQNWHFGISPFIMKPESILLWMRFLANVLICFVIIPNIPPSYSNRPRCMPVADRSTCWPHHWPQAQLYDQYSHWETGWARVNTLCPPNYSRNQVSCPTHFNDTPRHYYIFLSICSKTVTKPLLLSMTLTSKTHKNSLSREYIQALLALVSSTKVW